MDREKSPKHREDIKEYLVISQNYEVLLRSCIPREPKVVKWTLHKRTRTPWTIDFGLFKEYLREEKPELNNSCFEFDWSNVKELKYKKSTEDEVKKAMKEGYYLIRDFYKYNAGYGKIGNIFSIALNQYTDFLKE
jgi:hypothetical protein